MTTSIIARGSGCMMAPLFTQDERLLVCGQNDGVVYLEDGQALIPFLITGGAPTGLALDAQGAIFVCDQAQCALLLAQQGGSAMSVIADYEGRALIGPHSAVFDADNNLYFTDSGPAGETSLSSPGGVVYTVSATGRLLRPIATGLACPTGIALGGASGTRVLYVAEQAANRILRAVERPKGVWHFTVFAQFSGRLGPSAICVDRTRELIYVARAEMPDQSNVGIISVLSSAGDPLKEVPLNGYPELTGLCMAPDGASIVVTDASGAVLRILL
jgi:gluconolactonase